jgi:hypothetical protein
MKLAYSSKHIGGYLLAFFLLFGILTVASSSAQAQYPWGYGQDRRERRDRDDRYRDDRYRDDRYRNDRNRYGYEQARQQGYSYGLSVGAADAQRGQSYNPQRSHYWRNARGYDSGVFRSAFEQGYREGYQRYAYNRRGRRDSRWPWRY